MRYGCVHLSLLAAVHFMTIGVVHLAKPQDWVRLAPPHKLPELNGNLGRRSASSVNLRDTRTLLTAKQALVLRCLVHMPRSGAVARLRARIRALHDDLQSLHPLEPTGHLARHVRGSDRPQRDLGNGRHRCHLHQGAPLGRRRKRGAFAQA